MNNFKDMIKTISTKSYEDLNIGDLLIYNKTKNEATGEYPYLKFLTIDDYAGGEVIFTLDENFYYNKKQDIVLGNDKHIQFKGIDNRIGFTNDVYKNQHAELYFDGSHLNIKGNIRIIDIAGEYGSNGQVLTMTENGLKWGAGGDGSSGVINTDNITNAVGSYELGQAIVNRPIEEVVYNMLHKYSSPSMVIALTNGTTALEVGQTMSSSYTFRCTFSNEFNIDTTQPLYLGFPTNNKLVNQPMSSMNNKIINITIDKSEMNTADTISTSPATRNFNFTLTEKGKTGTPKEITQISAVTWKYRVFYGLSTKEVNDLGLDELTNSPFSDNGLLTNASFTTSTDQYIYYAYVESICRGKTVFYTEGASTYSMALYGTKTRVVNNHSIVYNVYRLPNKFNGSTTLKIEIK